MAFHTDVVVGKYYDGCDEQITGSVAKKLNDLAAAATTIHAIAVTKRGKHLVAVIVWE